jgi:hypothetical protein
MCTVFWLEGFKGRDRLEDLDMGGRLVLQWILGILSLMVWIRFMWLRVGDIGNTVMNLLTT